MGHKAYYAKYHALGNDYLFLDSSRYDAPSEDFIKQICHRNFGIGSDGILYGGYSSDRFQVKIFNPDASFAEISGNGLRIFARAMYDLGNITIGQEFNIFTNFKVVKCQILSEDKISVNMGIPLFNDKNIPIFQIEGINVEVHGRKYRYYPVSMSNPHCVIFTDKIEHKYVLSDGALLEKQIAFPEKTNVQFANVIDDKNIFLEIWERGAGHTLASGSSACAVFAVARKLKKCSMHVDVHMPGGTLSLEENIDNTITQCGPVKKIADCYVDIL